MRRTTRRSELIFEDALREFLRKEGTALLADVSERSTCARLSLYIENQLKKDGVLGYYADVEYNRKQGGKVKTFLSRECVVVKITADLIVHSRGELGPLRDNLIAVEAKKSTRPASEKESDRNRLAAMSMVPYDGVWPVDGSFPEHVCGYEVGIFLEIDAQTRQLSMEFFKKGALTKRKTLDF